MNYLIYVSTSAKLLNNNELSELLEESRENYNNKGITGMMLYSNGTIFQALEGEEEQLDQVFCSLQNDDLHKGVIKLKEGKERTRTFSDWSMGFKASYTDMITRAKGYVDPLRYDFLDMYTDNHPTVNLLKSFVQYNLQY